MLGRTGTACVVLLVTAAGCGTRSPDQAPEPTPPADLPVAEAPAPARAKTVDLRYKVKPQTDKVFSVRLPDQKPGGTMVTWSAYLSGLGAAASTSAPLKAECYVVQATGKRFKDRVFYLADDSSISTGFDISLSGSGVVDTRRGTHLTFECEIDENRPEPVPGLRWETFPQEPIQVTLTPLPAYVQRDHVVR